MRLQISEPSYNSDITQFEQNLSSDPDIFLEALPVLLKVAAYDDAKLVILETHASELLVQASITLDKVLQDRLLEAMVSIQQFADSLRRGEDRKKRDPLIDLVRLSVASNVGSKDDVDSKGGTLRPYFYRVSGDGAAVEALRRALLDSEAKLAASGVPDDGPGSMGEELAAQLDAFALRARRN